MSAVLKINRALEKELRSLGGVNSKEMIEARKAVARSWRRVLGTRGSGRPSAPGEAPRRQTGSLVKSVRSGVVRDQGRVVVQWFTGALLEEGVNTSLPIRSRKRQSRNARRHLVIQARPSAQRAIELVRDQLGGIVATVAGERLERAG